MRLEEIEPGTTVILTAKVTGQHKTTTAVRFSNGVSWHVIKSAEAEVHPRSVQPAELEEVDRNLVEICKGLTTGVEWAEIRPRVIAGYDRDKAGPNGLLGYALAAVMGEHQRRGGR